MKTWKAYVLAVSMLFFSGVFSVHGQEIGELDTTFGEDGKVLTSFGQFGDQAYAVALQSDGKILAAGSASNGDDFDLAIARYNKDGSLDTSFNNDGKVRTSLGDGDEEITAIAVQDDGYIVVAGYTVTDDSRDFVLVRFTPDGNFDHSFGEGGVVVTAVGNQDDEITAMIIDDDGRIVVSGYVTGTAGVIVAVARFLESGDLDVEFGDEGIFLTDVGGDALARSIDIDEQGRIVVTGSYLQGERTELMLLRFSESGDLDAGFGQTGVGVPADRETPSEGFGVRLMDDGLIMVAGAVGNPGDLDAAVFRFLDSGQPDPSFGENGVLITSASDEDDMALSIDVLDNVIGLSGYSTFNTKRDFLFVSVEETTDSGASVSLNSKTGSFLSTGKKYNSVFDLEGQQVEPGEDTDETTEKSLFSTTPFGYTDDLSFAVVLQTDGKAVSVGYSEQDGVSRFAVARYVTPVANAVGGAVEAGVGWILTKGSTNVTRTGAYSGGIILDSGLTITRRGVVYSIAPDPVYKEGEGETGPGPDPDPEVPGDGGTASPVITISNPPSADTADDTVAVGDIYSITYTLSDTDSASVNVTIYYNTTQTRDEDKVACGKMSKAPGTNTCSWNTAGVAAGKYYIYGLADDNTNTGSNWSTGQVTVNAADSAKIGASTQVASNENLHSPVASSVEIETLQVGSSSQDEPADEDTIGNQLFISNGSPYGEIAAGSSMTYIGVYTSDKSDCRFSPLSGQDFDSMPESMATADNLSHIAKVDGLQDDHDYSYFVRCRDLTGNNDSTDYEVSFKVASPENSDMVSYRRLKNILGNFFVATAHAQVDDIVDETPDDETRPSGVFDMSRPDYSLEGHTDDGGGNGSYSSILSNLKPGTFYYVRAYALDSNGKVYYGDQVGLKTADSCFIATAAYGTIIHPYVKVLRSFRDQYMITNVLGRNMVNLYYHYSPPIADYISSRPAVRGVVRVALLPVVGMGWLVLNVGFIGMALMALVLLMPSLLVYRSYRRLEVHRKDYA